MKRYFIILLVTTVLLFLFVSPILAEVVLPPQQQDLNDMLKTFNFYITKNISGLQDTAKKLFLGLVAIDLVLTIFMYLGHPDMLKTIIARIMKYSFVLYIILNYREIVNIIIDGFTWIGFKGAAQAVSIKTLTDPAYIAHIGARIMSGVITATTSVFVPVIGHIYLFFGILIFASIVSVAINFMVTYLEFYILALLSLVLIPFGANKYTSWVAQKVMNMLFAFGVKIMVLSFLAAVAIPIFDNWAAPTIVGYTPGKIIESLIYMTFGSVSLAILAWHAPSLAMTLVNGMPSLSASSVVTPAQQVASTALTLDGGMSVLNKNFSGSSNVSPAQSAAQLQNVINRQ